MKDKKTVLTTAHLTIRPENEADAWNCDWIITLKNDDERKMGIATFAGEKERGVVPISVTLEERFRNQGYGTEVFAEMVEWAFLHPQVYEITAVTDHENDKCIMALEKAGFVYRSKEGKTEYYSVTRPRSSWLGLYIIIGFVVGLILGIVVGSSWVGMAIGIVVGVALGSGMDAREDKSREHVVGKKESRKSFKK